MVLKVALSAGHGYHTPGKRTPDGEREWSFNDKVTRALQERLLQYEGVQVLRVDDPTGKTDVSLSERSRKANEWGADIYVANHHNAYQGVWGGHTGTETFTYNGAWGGKSANNPKEIELAKAVNDAIVAAYGLRNRGIKKENFHEVREPKCLAVLTEGGYMDSTIDIKVMRDDNKLRQSGTNQADAIAKLYGLKLKGSQEAKKPTPAPVSKTVDQLAQEVIKGLHGTGEARQKRLGSQYAAVQARVNQILAPNAKPAPKPQGKVSYKEEGFFYTDPRPDNLIYVRDQPSLKGKIVAEYYIYGVNESLPVEYHTVHINEGYVWLQYHRKWNGVIIGQGYIPCREYKNGKPQAIWGTIK